MLHALLEEGVSIRDLVRIFEALSVRAKSSTDLDGLVEAARSALGSAISHPYVTPDERLHVFTLEPGFEQRLLESVRPSDAGVVLALDAGAIDALVPAAAGSSRRPSGPACPPCSSARPRSAPHSRA